MRTNLISGLITGIVTLALLGLTGCGDGSGPAAATDPLASGSPGTPTSGGADDVGAAGLEHPTGADDVVLWIETAGGFVPMEYAFTNQPTVAITGDGRVFLPAADQESGNRRLRSMRVVSADEATIQQVLALAEEHGLLQDPPSYEDTSGPQISDAPTTVVSISAGGDTFEHAAYALTFPDGSDQDGPRAELAAFVGEVGALFDDQEGTPYEPAELRLLVEPFQGEPGDGTTVVDWPSGVDLAGAERCVTVPADGAAAALSEADFGTYFRQGDVIYTVAGAAVLPGSPGCPDGF